MPHAFYHWLESGTVVGVTSIATVVISALGIVVAVRVGSTKRQLRYGFALDIPLLLGAPEHSMQHLKVLYKGEPLNEPRVLLVRLISRGRKAITRENFDGDNPLTFDFGARVVALLGAGTKPKSATLPDLGTDQTKLEVWPSLILKRQTITVGVLVDGTPSGITCNRRLADVDIWELGDEPNGGRWSPAVPIVLLVCLALIGQVSDEVTGSLAKPSRRSEWRSAMACVVAIGWAATAVVRAIQRHRST